MELLMRLSMSSCWCFETVSDYGEKFNIQIL